MLDTKRRFVRRSGGLVRARIGAEHEISNVGRICPANPPMSRAGPRSLFFNTLREDLGCALPRGNRDEVEFYALAAPPTPRQTVASVLRRTFLDDGPVFHLLLEDLSDTHFAVSQWPLPPTLAQGEQILHTYARFHAFWWVHPQLETSVGRLRGPQEARSFLRGIRASVCRVDTLGDRLSPQRRRLRTGHRGRRAPDGASLPWTESERSCTVTRTSGICSIRSTARGQHPLDRLGQLADRHAHGRPRVHDGRALVSG